MIEPELKSDVEGIFKELGLSATEAINLFYRQVRLKKGLPFDVRMAEKIVREETLSACHDNQGNSQKL